MQIQINTDRNIEGHQSLDNRVRGALESALNHNSDHITRVEVHLSDESNKKGGVGAMRCLMEARLERHQPVAVTHHAETLDHAVHGAVDKLTRLIEHTIGRVREHKARGGVAMPEMAEETEE